MSIQFQNVSFSYPSHQVLKQFSYTLPQPGCIALVGSSGCGKTTILRLLCRLESPQSGNIMGLDDAKISVVFQEDRLLPWLTVQDNLTLVTQDHQAIETALDTVELTDYATQYSSSLSGGMRRRVALARALCYNGDVLLLDEPFTGIDQACKERIMEKILQQYQTRTIVLITHIIAEAEQMKATILSM